MVVEMVMEDADVDGDADEELIKAHSQDIDDG